jgi:glycine/D-amino acid oxidase-like deaminating enzyme
MSTERNDLIIVGGGVMGLFTAYYASRRFDKIVLIESGQIGDPATASFGRTRSYRRDYLDATYARFADEATKLWAEFEAATGKQVLVRAGCMNIATKSVTPELDQTYAQLSYDTLHAIGMDMQAFDTASIADRFPYLTADLAYLDPDAGLVDLGAVTETLLAELSGVEILQQTSLTGITYQDGIISVDTTAGVRQARALVVTAGHGTNDVLASIEGCSLQVPITKDRPSEAKYFTPTPQTRSQFTSDVMPVIAYLDTGIYLHPIVEGLIDKVKIGYYNPPDIPRGRTGVDNIADFVAQCMPGLADASYTDVLDVDQCDYDLVGDDDFVLGAIPGVPGAFVGVGWRGTGYKFAPWVGRVLSEMALQDGTVYDIHRFDPSRFQEGQFNVATL